MYSGINSEYMIRYNTVYEHQQLQTTSNDSLWVIQEYQDSRIRHPISSLTRDLNILEFFLHWNQLTESVYSKSWIVGIRYANFSSALMDNGKGFVIVDVFYHSSLSLSLRIIDRFFFNIFLLLFQNTSNSHVWVSIFMVSFSSLYLLDKVVEGSFWIDLDVVSIMKTSSFLRNWQSYHQREQNRHLVTGKPTNISNSASEFDVADWYPVWWLSYTLVVVVFLE